jgi:hypothetical protein
MSLLYLSGDSLPTPAIRDECAVPRPYCFSIALYLGCRT